MDTSPNSPSGIIATKLRPPRPYHAVIPRDHLVQHLRTAAPRLALISAPAGYGKTTLARLYVESVNVPCAWLSIDPNDSTLNAFLTYIIAACESAYPGMCGHSRAGLAAVGDLSAERMADRLIQDLADLDFSLVLVLDDYQFIEDLAVHQFVSRLIMRMPETLQLVITTRQDPPLPLARLRGHGQLLEIRSSQLRFTQTESEAFLRQFDALPQANLAELTHKADGWPVGLNLLAMSASTHVNPSPPANTLSAENAPMISDYFLEEVMQTIPESEQLLLTSLALPDRFTPEVCALLARELGVDVPVRDWFTRFSRSHLFLYSLDPNQNWYNFHQLFRTFLLNRFLRTREGEVIQHLYLRLTEWFVQREYIDEAIQYALAAGDSRRAAEIVEAYAYQAMATMDWIRLGRWLAQLPDNELARPGVSTYAAYLQRFRHQRSAAIQTLEEAETALARQDFGYTNAQIDEIQGSIWALKGEVVLYDQPEAARRYVENALKVLSTRCVNQISLAEVVLYYIRFLFEPIRDVITDVQVALDKLNRRPLTLKSVRLQTVIGTGFYQLADLDSLEHVVNVLMTISRQTGLSYGVGWAEYGMGWICYQRNDLDTAERHFMAVWQHHEFNHGRCVVDALTGLVLVYRLQGNDRAAMQALAWLEQFVRQNRLTSGIRVASLLKWQSNPHHAVAVPLPEFSVDIQDQLSPMHWVFPVMAAIRQYTALGGAANLQTAERLLHQCETNVYIQRDLRIRMEWLCSQALLLEAQGERDLALQTLEEAVTTAAERRMYRIIADTGRELAPLLRVLSTRGVATAFIEQVLSLIPSDAAAGMDSDDSFRPKPTVAAVNGDAADVSLTQRETDVLHLLAARYSDKEIARELVLSPRTVQKHTTNIYQKLHVGNRQEAVAEAQALGLLKPST